MPAQRLFESVTAVADPNGFATFDMPVPPTDLVWIGTLTCPTAPIAATFFATVAGSQWCSWAGQSIGGPVQAYMGEQVQIAAAGLTAGATFALQWIGRSDSVHETGPAYPDTNASPGSQISQQAGTSFTVVLQGGNLRASATTGSATSASLLASPPPGQEYALHNATLTVGSGATAVQIVGVSTGFVYAQAVTAAGLSTVPLEGQLVGEALILTTAGGGGSVWLSYDTIPPPTSSASRPHIVQSTFSSGIGTISLSLLGVTPGNFLIAGYGGQGSAVAAATAVGSTGAWTTVVATNQAVSAAAALLIAQANSGSVTVNITASGGNANGQFYLIEVANMSGTADTTQHNAVSGGTTLALATPITPAAASDLVIAVGGANTENITGTQAGWSTIGTIGAGGNAGGGGLEYLVPSGTTALSPTFTMGSSGNWAIVAAAFPFA